MFGRGAVLYRRPALLRRCLSSDATATMSSGPVQLTIQDKLMEKFKVALSLLPSPLCCCAVRKGLGTSVGIGVATVHACSRRMTMAISIVDRCT